MKGFHWGIIRESLYSIYFEIPKNEIVKEIDSLRLGKWNQQLFQRFGDTPTKTSAHNKNQNN